jgi:translation initiation factor IF-1
MSKGDHIELEGTVKEACGGGQYLIMPDEGQHPVRATLGGRLKKNHIRVLPGDRVKVSVSPYDLTHGMVTFRYR